MMMFQCDLSQPDLSRRVAWIEERGAIAGCMVELGGKGGPLWKVGRVYQPGIEEDVLKKSQRMNRDIFASLPKAVA